MIFKTATAGLKMLDIEDLEDLARNKVLNSLSEGLFV